MKRIKVSLGVLLFCTVLMAQKKDVECVTFRKGFDEFPLPGKGTITLTDGMQIPGEFRSGMVVKMDKWQWYDKKNQLHQIKKKDVKRVEFYPDKQFVDKDIEVDVSINIGGKSATDVESKNLPFNITQFKDFDTEKFYQAVVLERVVKSIGKNGDEKSDLMLLVNNGFDSKYKVYVPLGAKQVSFGRELNIPGMLLGIGKEMGDYYKTIRVQKVGAKESVVLKNPALFSFWIGSFRNKEFVDLFGDNTRFMQECYPKSMKRKFKYTPEFFWVYDHL